MFTNNTHSATPIVQFWHATMTPHVGGYTATFHYMPTCPHGIHALWYSSFASSISSMTCPFKDILPMVTSWQQWLVHHILPQSVLALVVTILHDLYHNCPKQHMKLLTPSHHMHHIPTPTFWYIDCWLFIQPQYQATMIPWLQLLFTSPGIHCLFTPTSHWSLNTTMVLSLPTQFMGHHYQSVFPQHHIHWMAWPLTLDAS